MTMILTKYQDNGDNDDHVDDNGNDYNDADDKNAPQPPHWRFFFPVRAFLGTGLSSLLVIIMHQHYDI